MNINFSMETKILGELKSFGEDSRWLRENKDDLRKEYKNQFVAVKDKDVIAADADLKKLVEKLRKDGIDTSSIVIEFISEKPIRVIY